MRISQDVAVASTSQFRNSDLCVEHIGVVRFDDLLAGVSWEFIDPVRLYVADHVDQVIPVLTAATEAARAGKWVAGLVTYEAAPAFDRAFASRQRVDGLPLACFIEFTSRRVGETLDVGPTAFEIESLERAGGSAWFRAGVTQVRERIALGDVYQVNLTDRLIGRYAGSPIDLYRSMIWAQKGAYNAFIDLGRYVVVSASPELFFEFDGSVVTAKPMKGTAPRRARQADDVAAARYLATSVKDCAENVMIVDLVRNDLSRLARSGGVSVPALFDVERYETVWQLTSTVRAEVRPGTTTVDVMRVLFPCGSVTGAPKIAATRIINELEPFQRGLYCGAIGFIGPSQSTDKLEPHARFSVAIRTAVIDKRVETLQYGSGGGITWDSDPTAEDAELIAKTAVLTARRPVFEIIETLLFNRSGAQHFEFHLQRLTDSAAYFGFELDRARLSSSVQGLAWPSIPQRLRITLNNSGDYTLSLSELEPGPVEVRLGVSPMRIRSDDPFVCHKTTNRAHYDRALAEVPHVDDVILVNERDEIVETTISSLLYRLGGSWFTTPLSSGGLNGIGRRVLLESGVVVERLLVLDELESCDAFAVVSSLRGRRPASLDFGGYLRPHRGKV